MKIIYHMDDGSRVRRDCGDSFDIDAHIFSISQGGKVIEFEGYGDKCKIVLLVSKIVWLEVLSE